MGLIVSTLQQIAHALFEPEHNPERPPDDSSNQSKNSNSGDNQVKDDPEQPEHPVLLIPGIAGTILHVKDNKKQEYSEDQTGQYQGDKLDEGSRVWVTVIGAETKFQKLFCRFNLETKMVEQINPDHEVIIPTKGMDDGGLYAVETLDPDLLIPLNVVKYYFELIKYLQKSKNYTPNSTMFGFGYDFRQSNGQHAADLLKKLQGISEKCGGKKIDIITHSMGGLVVQGFLAKYPQYFEQYIRKWVCIACPFQGASGYTIDSLLTGCGFSQGWEEYLVRYLYVHRHTFQQVLSESPSMFDLLPSLDYNWSQVDLDEPIITVFLQKQKPQVNKYPTGLQEHTRSTTSLQNIQKAYINQSNGADLSSSQAVEFLNPVALDKNPRDFSILEQNGTITRRYQKCDRQRAKLKSKHKPNISDDNQLQILKLFFKSDSVSKDLISQKHVSIWPWPDNNKDNKKDDPDDDNKVYVLETKFSQFQILMDNILVEHTVHDNEANTEVPINMNPGCFTSAKEFLQLRDGVQLPGTCEFYNLYGKGTDTPFSIQYGSPEAPLDTLQGVYLASAVYQCIEGDGTVPLYSSIGDNFKNNVIERKDYVGNHRGLLNDATVHQQVLQWLDQEGSEWEMI